jgi:hypothetical protein
VKKTLRAQVLPALTLLLVLVTVGVVLQLWLLGASVDGWLAGKSGVALPAAIASVALCLLNAGLLSYALRIDHHVRLQAADQATAHTEHTSAP